MKKQYPFRTNDEGLIDEIKDLAKKSNRSMNQQIEYMLRTSLQNAKDVANKFSM